MGARLFDPSGSVFHPLLGMEDSFVGGVGWGCAYAKSRIKPVPQPADDACDRYHDHVSHSEQPKRFVDGWVLFSVNLVE